MKHLSSETAGQPARASKDQLSARAILAITIPISFFLASLAWAVSAYFMEREKQDTQRELARLKSE